MEMLLSLNNSRAPLDRKKIMNYESRVSSKNLAGTSACTEWCWAAPEKLLIMQNHLLDPQIWLPHSYCTSLSLSWKGDIPMIFFFFFFLQAQWFSVLDVDLLHLIQTRKVLSRADSLISSLAKSEKHRIGQTKRFGGTVPELGLLVPCWAGL